MALTAEQLAEIDSSDDPDSVIDSIDRQLQQQKKQLLQQLSVALDAENSEQDQLAADLIRKLKFFYKLQQELELIEQQLQD